jgi:hypothetical protein
VNAPRKPTDGPLPIHPWGPLDRETLIDRQIREAREAGAFDDLPYQGERIPLEDESLAGDWALANHVLKNAGMVPPWIATDREVRALLERRDAILARAPRSGQTGIGRERDRRELREVVAAANRTILILNNEAPTDRQHRRLLDPEVELARLAAAHEGGGP